MTTSVNWIIVKKKYDTDTIRKAYKDIDPNSKWILHAYGKNYGIALHAKHSSTNNVLIVTIVPKATLIEKWRF